MDGKDIIRYVKEWKQAQEGKYSGSPLVTSIPHVSRSGMKHVIEYGLITKEGRFIGITYIIARELGVKLDPKYCGIALNGCGYNKVFELWYRFINRMRSKAPELLSDEEWNEYAQMGCYTNRM